MSTPAQYAERVVSTTGDCPMCGGTWTDHAHLGGASIRCPDGTTVDVLPANALSLWEPHTRELPVRRDDAAIDRWFGAATMLVGGVVAGVGIFRTQACIPIYVYGAALVLVGQLLWKAGRR